MALRRNSTKPLHELRRIATAANNATRHGDSNKLPPGVVNARIRRIDKGGK